LVPLEASVLEPPPSSWCYTANTRHFVKYYISCSRVTNG
jgi:hypothetical protein